MKKYAENCCQKIQWLDPYEIADYDALLAGLYQGEKLQKIKNRSDRAQFFSERFLGASYLSGALGEGPDACFDQSPLYRTDAFDCVTFVNTALALAFSNNEKEFQQNMLRINYYDAEPQYHKRFHFMSVDWNPQNKKSGFVKDITTSIVNSAGRPIYEIAKAKIDRPSWLKQRTLSDIKLLQNISGLEAEQLLKKIHGLASAVKSELSELPYLPFDSWIQDNPLLLAQIPRGAVIEIVRPNWNVRDKIGTNINVSHVGFGFRINNELIFRHASLQEKRVVDVPLFKYLQDKCRAEPSIRGINVQCIAG